MVLLRVGFTLPAGLLQPRCALTAPFHPYLVRGGIFSVALSVKSALSESPRPLAGTLPYGDRTFLPPVQERLPTRQAKAIMPRSQNLHATQIKQLDSLFASEQFGSILIVVSRKEGPSNCLGSPIVILYLALRLLVLDLI